MLELWGMACLVLAWLVPDHYPPWMSIYNELLAALGLLLILIASLKQWRSRAPNPAWLLMAVAVIPPIQFATGLLRFSGDALVSSLYIGGFGIAIAVGSMWSRNEPRRSAALLAGACLFGALASGGLACLQALQLDLLGPWVMNVGAGARATANLGQPNNLATLLGIGAAGLLLLYEQRKIGASAAAAMLFLLLAGTALTQSRTSLLFGPIIIAGILLSRRRGVRFRARIRTIAIATLAQWALMLAWPVLQRSLLLSAPESLMARGLETVRRQMWPMLLHALSLSPWHGYGWLQVGAAELAVVNAYPPVGELWLHGHNLFLELLIWCGYPIGLLLIGLVVFWYVTRLAKARTVEAMMGMLVVSIVGLHAMLELPHHYAYFLIPVGLWIGQVEPAIGVRGAIPARFGLLPVALALFVIVGLIRQYPAVEEDFRLVRFEHLRIGTVRAAQPAPDAPLLSSLTGFLAFARTRPAPGMSQDALMEMRAVAERYPYPPSLARFASALALNGQLDEAVQTFVKIRQVFDVPTYRKMRRELLGKVDEGEIGLRPLYEALPE